MVFRHEPHEELPSLRLQASSYRKRIADLEAELADAVQGLAVMRQDSDAYQSGRESVLEEVKEILRKWDTMKQYMPFDALRDLRAMVGDPRDPKAQGPFVDRD